MDPLTMALISGGLGLSQVLAGSIASSKNKAPQYSVPTEYGQNLAEAQTRAASGLPSASKQLATEQMARGTAAGLTKLNDRNMVATGVASLAQGEADQANRLAVMDAQARLSGQKDVAAARLAIAGAKDKDFAIKQQDYLRKAQANAGLINGGIQNIVGGMQNYGMMDLMKKYYNLGEVAPKNPLGTEVVDQASVVAEGGTPSFGMFNTNPYLGMFKNTSGFNMFR